MRVRRRFYAVFICCSLLSIALLYVRLQSLVEFGPESNQIVDYRSLPADQDTSSCQLTSDERESYPNCLTKLEWLRGHWRQHNCFADFGVNSSICSRRNYLSRYEDHCPPINESRGYRSFQPNTSIESLFGLMTDNPGNYNFIRSRTTTLWSAWTKAIAEMTDKYHHQFNNYRKLNIIVHLGFLMKESKINFAAKSTAGGPLGELVQWSDLIAVLHILGHNLYLTTEKTSLTRNIEFFSGHPCPGDKHIDLIVSDIMGFLRVFRRNKMFASDNSCKFRFVDSFGTHAEFNNKQYFLRHKLKFGGSRKNPWGGHGLRLKQYWTFYPHTSDNGFLGFVVQSEEKPLLSRERNKAVLIYGKEQYMWDNMTDIIETLKESHEVHATVADADKTAYPVFNKVVNHGFLNQSQLSSLLQSVEAFVGLGFPLEGPAPLEAIASGTAFINPKFDPPQFRGNTKFLKEKPTLRRWTSQVPYLEKLGEPYVYTVDIHNKDELRKTMEKVFAQQRDPFVPLDFRPLGMLLRVNQMTLNEDLCVQVPRYPPKSELVIATGQGSCDDICSVRSLLCESAFFPFINKDSTIRQHFSCSTISQEDSVTAPHDCVRQRTDNLFSCASLEEGHTRICPCRAYNPDYSPFPIQGKN